MKKGLIILLAIIGMGAVCATEPIDDVYYWPAVQSKNEEKKEIVNEKVSEEKNEGAIELGNEEKNQKKEVEFVNVQDTTVTIKINR